MRATGWLCLWLLVMLSGAQAWAQSAELVVKAKEFQGSAWPMRESLGAGGPLAAYLGRDSAAAQAWKRVGFKYAPLEMLHAEGADAWLNLRRNDDLRLEIDFTAYDARMRDYLQHLQIRPMMHLGVPRLLSSKPEASDYGQYSPKNMKEWGEFTQQIVRHNVQFHGLAGMDYAPPSQADLPGQWKGSGDPAQRLEDHVALYAATYRAVKQADPTARMGGPGVSDWRPVDKQKEPQRFSLEEWLAALARYNTRLLPGELPVGLDFVLWQDHGAGTETVAEAAHAVGEMLTRQKFRADLPKILGGGLWGGWSSGHASLLPHQRASHVLDNLLVMWASYKERPVERAYYSYFLRDERWPNAASYPPTEMVRITPQGDLFYTSVYAAFQMFYRIGSGNWVTVRGPGGVRAIATRNEVENRASVLINNHSNNAKSLLVKYEGIDYGPQVWYAIQRIDEKNSQDGFGLQEPVWRAIALKEITQAGLTIAFPPYASVLLTVAPRNPGMP